jgi:uncharacterized iron-regulated protein
MIALQREVFHRNRERINRAVYGYTRAYRQYEAQYQARVRKYARAASFAQLLGAIQKASIIYLGDYHTLRQAQRTVVRLLRHLPIELRPTFAVEFVEGRYQRALDDYLAGRAKESTFLRRIRHDASGVFGAWENFRPIFEFAREHQLPMVGIDSQLPQLRTSLRVRDNFAAERIAEAVAARPDHPVFVHIGELHIAPEHLPKLVQQKLAKRGIRGKKSLVLYQNCEEIYWQLEARGLEHEVEVVEVRAGEWCVINTPPIVAQQSFLNWLDNDDELFEEPAPEKIFREYVEIITRVLGIAIGDAADHVVVSSVVDTQFLDILRKRGRFNKHELEEIRRQILRSESYFIPKANMVYLGQLSINHAAEEASHFVRHAAGGDEEPRYLVDAFYWRVLNEAIGFLGSKLVNHKRKCPHERDFQRLLADKTQKDPFLRELASYVVQHRRMERGERTRGLRDVYESDVDMFNAVTHALGYMLGDRLYYALLAGTIDKPQVRELYFEPFEDEGAALSTYLHLVAQTAGTKIPQRIQ